MTSSMEQKEFDFQRQPGKRRVRFHVPDVKDAKVSIITPFYNAGKYFEQTFNSVVNQTFPWFEWIIVNDGSPNQEDVELLYQFAAQDKRITIITQENAGPCKARNTAIENTHTDLIVPLDADDLIDPTFIECLFWSLKYHPEAAWSYPNSYGFQELEYIWNPPFSAKRLKTYNFLNYIGMIRKKDIVEIGGYKYEKFAYHEDWRFWLDMLSMSKKPIHVNSFLFWYRRLGTGRMSSVNNDKKLTKACNKIIADAAKTVDVHTTAIEYPMYETKFPYYASKDEIWKEKTYTDHKNKRILWLVPWMVMGGADKFNLDAISGLQEKGFDNFIIATRPSENEWRQEFQKYTDEIFCLPDFLDPAHYLEFVSYFIQTREIDIVMVTNSYDGYYMMPWIRQHFPNIALVDYVHMEELYWRDGGYARISGRMDGITEKTYVCNSGTRTFMIESYGRKKESVETVYIGVDEKYFERNSVSEGNLYKELSISDKRPIVLFICRLHPQKRPYLMLQIAKKVAQKIPDVAFVSIGGEEQQQNELMQTAKNEGIADNVYFLGQRKDVRPYYRDAKVTLICSLKEGLSLTAYESCSMGVPVVSADVGGQGDLIDENVGKLIPCVQSESECLDERSFSMEEIDAYADAIYELLTNQEIWMKKSENCREKIEQHFTIDLMVEYFCKEFMNLLEDEKKSNQRQKISESLKAYKSLGSEFYMTGMNMQCAEDVLYRPTKDKDLVYKAIRILREKGFREFWKKMMQWSKKRVKNIIRKG